jgi:molecular chaperone GrpE
MSGQPERPEDEGADPAIEGQIDEESVAEEIQAEGTAEGEDQASDPVAEQIAELEAKVAENWDKYLRTSAELENVRKRAARDVEKAHKFALERFSTDLLEVRDSLEMALATGDGATVESLREGSETTLKLMSSVMQRFGVAELDPHGQPFDPEQHEAVTMQPSADAEPGSVLTVFQKGYALNGRLLRPARVVVAAEAEK